MIAGFLAALAPSGLRELGVAVAVAWEAVEIGIDPAVAVGAVVPVVGTGTT